MSAEVMCSITNRKGTVYAAGTRPKEVYATAQNYWNKNPTMTRKCHWRLGGRSGNSVDLRNDYVEPRVTVAVTK